MHHITSCTTPMLCGSGAEGGPKRHTNAVWQWCWRGSQAPHQCCVTVVLKGVPSTTPMLCGSGAEGVPSTTPMLCDSGAGGGPKHQDGCLEWWMFAHTPDHTDPGGVHHSRCPSIRAVVCSKLNGLRIPHSPSSVPLEGPLSFTLLSRASMQVHPYRRGRSSAWEESPRARHPSSSFLLLLPEAQALQKHANAALNKKSLGWMPIFESKSGSAL